MFLKDELGEIVDQMKARQVEFAPGLPDAEITDIEQRCKFQFPPDLRQFLQLGVPLRWKPRNSQIDESFPNWQDNPVEIMSEARKWTLRAFTYDVEHANFWMQEWGERPQELSEAFAVVEHYLETAPVLIPIHAHRFIPAEPNLAGNPVFSVWQAVDTIYYGCNLQRYLKGFISEDTDLGELSDYRTIRFWSKIVS